MLRGVRLVTENHFPHGTRIVNNLSFVVFFYSKETEDTLEHVSSTNILQHQINSGHKIQCLFEIPRIRKIPKNSFSFYVSLLCLCLTLAFKSPSKQVAYFSRSRCLWLSHLEEVKMYGEGYSGIKS